ncbi:DNA repair protein rad52 [Saxophila tyrrhenica]|uniref:RAD52 homolog n=1 Tax=Saxophila tyrrhenica TaxID=1690608 RepID=A0AAV9PCK6_9PEZI|nr:DNA repair protein rad52 [Saxophila tyrrhenica]
MPLPGDQHKPTPATTNPFLEQKQHITEYSAAEIATLQYHLNKQLGPEYVSTRPGAGGGKVHYLAAEKAINLANEVFGFNGWSSSIQNVQIDFVDEHPQSGKISLGLSTIVRVTIRDGTFHEDMGYGHIENCKGKAAAFEKAKKEAVTDAMKRALRNFGNVLGNCLYDKDYLQRVQKIKVQPSRWDADKNLHRHPDFAPIKQESATGGGVQQRAAQQRHPSAQSNNSFGSGVEMEDDFGGNAFDETDFDHADGITMDDVTMETPDKSAATGPAHASEQQQGVSRMHSMPQRRPPNVQAAQPIQAPQTAQRPQGAQRPEANAPQGPPPARMPPPQQPVNHPHTGQAPAPPPPNRDSKASKSNSSSVTAAADTASTPEDFPMSDAFSAPRMPPPGNPEGFVTGRSAELLNQPAGSRPPNVTKAQPFNPHVEATTIRRTPGLNPGKSAPITRSTIQQQNQNGDGQQTQARQHPGIAAGPPYQQRPQSPAPPHANGLNGATTPVRANFVNPSADTSRRIGMPGGMQNRGGYKPPTSVNSPAGGALGGGVKRAPLTDVSNLQMQQTDGPADPKKPKLDHPEKAMNEAVGGEQHQTTDASAAAVSAQ